MRPEEVETIIYIIIFLIFLIGSIVGLVIALLNKGDPKGSPLVIKPPFKQTATTVLSSTISEMAQPK